MTDLALRNRRSAALAALMALAMVGLGFAAVPLYRLFCQVTGFGGTTMRATEADLPTRASSVQVAVRFDANTASGLPWRFGPEQPVQRVAVGARDMAFYYAQNLTDRPVTGRAVFNVSPDQAGKYFNKIECFCFTEQTLKPGERVRMPVTFFVDPAILDDPDTKDIQQITLSYTFYPVDSAGQGS
jgi:cytochrome c oxidase assembly protein subunit 11